MIRTPSRTATKHKLFAASTCSLFAPDHRLQLLRVQLWNVQAGAIHFLFLAQTEAPPRPLQTMSTICRGIAFSNSIAFPALSNFWLKS